jgi:hypothetical protein
VTIYQDRNGIVDIHAHREYLAAMDREDVRLERRMADIRRRRDAGELRGAESAAERAEALENHLTCCRALRRQFLGGS